MPSVGGHTYHILIDNVGFFIREGTYFKTQQAIAQIPTFGKPVDLSPNKKWTQSSWKGGLGQKRVADAEMYDDGQVDSYSDPTVVQTPPQLSSVSTATVSVFKDQAARYKFEVRAWNDSANAALYLASTGLNDNNGDVWWLPSTGGALAQLTQQAKHFSALLNSFHDDPHNLMFGTEQEAGSPAGKLYRFPSNSNVFNATPLNNSAAGGGVFNQPRVTCFANYNDADYIGIGKATQGAKVYKMTSGATWAITLFKDVDCHFIADMKTWNGRLWILAVMRNRESRLYVTDGNVVSLAYKWTDAFYGNCLFEFGGSLYIGGGRMSYDETLGYGQVWRYNGSAINLVGQFDEGGFSDAPVWTATVANDIKCMTSWGKFLAVGMNNRAHLDGSSHRGIWLYDPAQDAWHQGAYKDAADTAHTGAFVNADNRVWDLREFDGALYFSMTDSAGKLYYLQNAKTAFVTGMYRSSIFDAGLPQEKKLFTRLLVDLELPAQGRVAAYYSTDEGVTWSSVTNFDNATDASVRGIYTLNLGTSGLGVIAKSIQLKLFLYPGKVSGSGGAPGNTSGPLSTKVHSHMVEYSDSPDVLYRWQFSVPCATHAIGPDEKEDSRTGDQVFAALLALQDGLVHTLTDKDGSTFAVVVDTVNEYIDVLTPDATQGLHHDASVVLVQKR